MSVQAGPSPAWTRACLAAALVAIDPGLGGICLRARAGPVREEWLTKMRALLPQDAPFRRMPVAIGADRLTGALDLTATLRAGRLINDRGLLAEAAGGVLLIAMAERLEAGTAALIAGAADAAGRFSMIALDEGLEPDERPPAALLDRMAFHLALEGIALRDTQGDDWTPAVISQARARLSQVASDDKVIEALCVTAVRLGVGSMRAPLFALRAARACAALDGRLLVEDDDVSMAAQLVLAPRATLLPASEPPPDEGEQEPPPETNDKAPEDKPPPDQSEGEQDEAPANLDDIVLAAARAAIPPDLLAQLEAGLTRQKSARAGKAGATSVSARRGRPLSARRGELRAGRLSLIETLRAAAPWQRARRAASGNSDSARVFVVPSDFRIVRFAERTETTTIFVVDASGSAARQRLAEVKGAIELLLADCYVRRDSVALISFRGQSADLALAPTRSLARAKRSLAGLPGGGGTPLAHGIDAAAALAETVSRKGQSPLIVFMTDGRANIARDGAPGRAKANEDALASAKRLRATGVAALVIDTSSKLQMTGEPLTRRLGEAMGARHIALPQANAELVSEVVRSAAAQR